MFNVCKAQWKECSEMFVDDHINNVKVFLFCFVPPSTTISSHFKKKGMEPKTTVSTEGYST